jgi:hypothetical protein
MIPEQFTSYVQWPGDRSFITGGGSSSGTSAGADVGGEADTFNDIDDIDDFDIDDQTTLRQMMDSLVNRDGSDEEMAGEDEASASDDE